MLTPKRIEAAYTKKALIIAELAEIVEDLLDMKNKRAVELAQKVEAGLYADCKNEDQRKAAAANAFQLTDNILRGMESKQRAEQLQLDLTLNEIAAIDMLMRLNECDK